MVEGKIALAVRFPIVGCPLFFYLMTLTHDVRVSFPLETIGIVPGTLLEVTDADGSTCVVEISGLIP